MTWNYNTGTPTIAAPQSFVNFESTVGTFTRIGAGPSNWTSVWGGWYGATDGTTNLQRLDTTPGNTDLDDGKDETLIAKFYVNAGTDINFLALDNGTDTVGLAGTAFNGNLRFTFDTRVVPEPGTIVLLASGLMGLLCYAWRKRK